MKEARRKIMSTSGPQSMMTGVKTQPTVARTCVAGIKVKRKSYLVQHRNDEATSIQLNKLEPPSIRDTGWGLAYRSGEAWNEFGQTRNSTRYCRSELNRGRNARREVAVKPQPSLKKAQLFSLTGVRYTAATPNVACDMHIAYHSHAYAASLQLTTRH